jgi:outer membrane protein assembly factor BamB
VPFFAARNGSWIRATPAYDGDALYVAGIRDLLVCLDAKDGTIRWRVDFPNQFKAEQPAFGFVCSPIVDGEAVYVQAGASFAKVNKKTGEVVWRALNDAGGMFGSAFSSPVFETVAGVDQVLVQTRLKLAGVDRKSGNVLWSQPIPAEKGMNILTPVKVGDAVFTSSYGGGTRLVSVKAGDDKKVTPADAWATKFQGYMTTPVVVDGHAYLFGRNRKLACIDVKTGQEKWLTEKTFGEYWSLVAQKDKILALDSRGILYLIKANPKEFELLDERKLGSAETWAHLAVAGDEVFVRDLNGLTAFRWSAKPR